MYTKIYEHPECPNEDVIEDDDALDGWMLEQQKKNAKEKTEKGVDNLIGKYGKNAQEVFLMPKDEKEFDQINELNSNQSMAKINARRNLGQGEIKEDSDFSDTQAEMLNKIAELNKRK
jgi:hypothetical protein